MALMTVISAAFVPPFIPVSLKYSAVDAATACAETNDTNYYIPEGFSFGDTPVIWLNDDGTGVPPAGVFSDSLISRAWNGVDTLTPSSVCPNAPYELSFQLDDVNLCDNIVTASYYFGGSLNFAGADSIYTDVALTLFADPGFYGDSFTTREWNGAMFINAWEACNYDKIILKSSASEASICTSIFSFTFMIDQGSTWDTTVELFRTVYGDLAEAGWYSDGITKRQWDGAAFVGVPLACP